MQYETEKNLTILNDAPIQGDTPRTTVNQAQSDKAHVSGHYIEAIEVDFGSYTDSIDNRHIYRVTGHNDRVVVEFTDHNVIIEGKNLKKLASDIRRKVLPRIVVVTGLSEDEANELEFYVDKVEFKEKPPEK